jgi:serine/threonine-protein kinase ATR
VIIKAKQTGAPHKLLEQGEALVGHLLELCNQEIPKNSPEVTMEKYFKGLYNYMKKRTLNLIIPLQASLTVTLPPDGKPNSTHKAFLQELPTIQSVSNNVSVMPSLQRPRKICFNGSDGKEYWFLCKPKDDLRKDCRMMEFNTMINKLLKKDPGTRRRNICIQTIHELVNSIP